MILTTPLFTLPLLLDLRPTPNISPPSALSALLTSLGLPPPPSPPLLDTLAIGSGGLVENVDIVVGSLPYKTAGESRGGPTTPKGEERGGRKQLPRHVPCAKSPLPSTLFFLF